MNTCESLSVPMHTLSSINVLSVGAALQPEVAVATATDHALLEAIRTGDQDAFAELVARYRNSITSFIFRMTSDYDGAVDLAQETFVRVFRAADRYESTNAFSTYIYRIATNLALTELHKRKRCQLISLTDFFHMRDGHALQDLNPRDLQPLQDVVMVDEERRSAVQRAIGTLPGKYRAPLILRDIEGKTYDEISQILSITEGTVKSRLSRARGLLREKMVGYL